MIAAFLLPFPLRGYRAPYLWVYYRLLSSFGERMLFVASEDYTRAPEYWQAQNRWEMQPGNAQRLHYQVPTREDHGRAMNTVFCPRRFSRHCWRTAAETPSLLSDAC